MKKVNLCRCCKGKNLVKYLNLGKQPLANSYHKGESLPEFQLEVMLCENCFHSQLSIVVDPDLLFKNYLYVSGTTNTFKKHCKDLAEDAVRRVGKGASVLDIGCNDGTQLEFFRELNCSVQGVDPAENLSKITLSKKIPVVVNYWNQKIARELNRKFDLITGTNVFAHVDDLDEFLNAVKVSLKDNGILILEFPYVQDMIANHEFDTVYHEHLSYFTVNSFKALMDRMGLYIVDILQTSIHGGSIRFFVSKNGMENAKKINHLIEKEKNKGILLVRTYREFTKKVAKNKRDFSKLINDLRLKNKKIIGYGASAKGNTMLNYFKVDLDYIVDDNPIKWNYRTPGRNIIIKSPQALKVEQRNLNIVILSWNFYKEIIRKIISIRGRKTDDRALLYVPNVEFKKISAYKDDNVST